MRHTSYMNDSEQIIDKLQESKWLTCLRFVNLQISLITRDKLIQGSSYRKRPKSWAKVTGQYIDLLFPWLGDLPGLSLAYAIPSIVWDKVSNHKKSPFKASVALCYNETGSAILEIYISPSKFRLYTFEIYRDPYSQTSS